MNSLQPANVRAILESKTADSPHAPIQSIVTNQRGQGLIEYLIIVALMGVATMGVMRVMSGSVISRFGSVTAAIQGNEKKYRMPRLNDNTVKQKDMGTFMEGSSTKETNNGI